jgi:pimeloyl-ACP methyl ester carboxylesterase
MVANATEPRSGSVMSQDGARIAYHSVGAGPGLVVVGGVLYEGIDYLPLARLLAGDYQVHLVERRGRPGSDHQGTAHSIEDECADLEAVATATGARAVFGHSFGGLVALETARQRGIFDELFVYDPGVPIRGSIATGWIAGYRDLLERGDSRGAFAWMVKYSGNAPRPIEMMPIWYLRLVLRLAVRGAQWQTMQRLLRANVVEHQVQAALDAPNPSRFSTVRAHAVLLAGSKSPDFVRRQLLEELAAVIPGATVRILPGIGHLAPTDHPSQIAAAILTDHRRGREQEPSDQKAPSIS